MRRHSRRLRHLRPENLILQLAPRDLDRRPIAKDRQEVLAQYTGALAASLLLVEHFLYVFVHHVFQRIRRLALRGPLACRVLLQPALFELGVFPLLPLQPLPFHGLRALASVSASNSPSLICRNAPSRPRYW